MLLVLEFELAEARGDFSRGPAVLGHAVERGARGAEFPVHGCLVEESDAQLAFADHRRLDIHEVAIVRGRLELHVQFEDGGGEPFGFHVGVACAGRAEKLGTGLFKPYGVNGVVDNAHLVSFRVADFDAGGMGKSACFHGINI